MREGGNGMTIIYLSPSPSSLLLLLSLLIVKIKPRRNSTLVPSKGPRRQHSTHQSPGGPSRQIQRQSSKQRSSSPMIPHSPTLSSPPNHDDMVPTRSETSLRRDSEMAPGKEDSPHLEIQDSSIELAEVEVMMDGQSSSTRKGSTGIRMNTSTPINDLEDSPVISTSVSITVDGSYTKERLYEVTSND